ncbi:MAG TPA: TonB-dependent receptor [Verrucomicrobiae bacterium]|nr:TonB-dependent receptor [Verrucomicrobiae bacterium]
MRLENENRPYSSPAELSGGKCYSPGLRVPRGLVHFFIKSIFFALILFLLTDAHCADSTNNINSTNIADLSLEDLMKIEVPVVTSASKVAQKTTEAPASVTVINADEIQRYGQRTLADVLRSVQGFNVSYDRNYAFLDARGLSLGDFNSRVLLLVDGHRVNNNLTDGAFIDTAFILDVDLIDHVEIIRGPNSVLYGNNAFFGVINVVTRQGRQINGLETSAEYGSFDEYKVRATYGKLFTNGLEMLVSGTYYDNPGPPSLFYKEFDTPTQNNGVANANGLDEDKYGSLFGSLSYEDFSLESAYISREKGNPTAQYSLTTFNDPRLRTTDDRSYVALKFAHSFPDVVDVTARVYYDRYRHEIGYPQSLVVGTNVLFSGFTLENDTGQWWGSELELNKQVWEKHTLTVGAEYRDDFHQEQDITGQPSVMLTRQSYGVYGQGDFELLANLHLEAGVRYDKSTDFPSAVTPRLALIYHPFTNSTIKAIYGTAFRTPNFSELSDPRFRDINPERISTYELIYEQQIGPHVRSSLSGFYNKMDNLIVFNSGSFTNINAETEGVELALEGVFADGIRGRASYSYQHTRDETLSWSMPDSPSHMVKLNLSVPVWQEKIFADLEFQYVSDRASLHNTTDSGGEPLTVQGQTAGAYEIVNFTIFSRELVKNLEVSASIYNLFNAHYSDPASRFHTQDLIEQDGRTFRVKATYRF